MSCKSIAATLVAAGLAVAPLGVRAETLAFVGGTVIDVAEFGNRSNDIQNAIVIVDDGRIAAVGTEGDIPLTAAMRRIDVRGRYLVPGLVEGFGGSTTQGFANAWLYNGVTTVSTNAGDTRRGATFTAHPGPNILTTRVLSGYVSNDLKTPEDISRQRLEGRRRTTEELVAAIDTMAASGANTVLAHYDVWPDQVDLLVREAKKHGLGTFGEFGWTSYWYGARARVGVFVHSQRYLSALAPPDLLLAYSDGPFGPGARPVVDYVLEVAADGPEVERYGRYLAANGVALMPNLVLGEHWGGHPAINPWHARSARLVRQDEVHFPIDPATGFAVHLSTLTPEEREKKLALNTAIKNRWNAINARFHALGVHFVAASGGPAFGVLPGSGMVDEVIAMQNTLGMTPRQALATATSNYKDTLGWKGIGRLERGHRADILVLGSDPRTDVAAIRDIRILVAGGAIIDRGKLLKWRHTNPPR